MKGGESFEEITVEAPEKLVTSKVLGSSGCEDKAGAFEQNRLFN